MSNAQDISTPVAQKSQVSLFEHEENFLFRIFALNLGLQMFHLFCIFTLLALISLLWITNGDFKKFQALGPGGTPPTFFGYLKITVLRLFALSDPYTPIPPSKLAGPETDSYNCMRLKLPNRSGPRPQVTGIAPQRQVDQFGCLEIYQSLRRSIAYFALTHQNLLKTSRSCFEKNGLALLARNPVKVTCEGEICHIHHNDRSLHMSLHLDDANVVLEHGWGERHPLARGRWMTAYVPREFIMVYAPRDRAELDVVHRIIEASVLWVCGERFEGILGNNNVEA